MKGRSTWLIGYLKGLQERRRRIRPWRTPKRRPGGFSGKVKAGQRATVSKRDRAKMRSRLRKLHGLTRSQCGAIGAGNHKPPVNYAAAVEWIKFKSKGG